MKKTEGFSIRLFAEKCKGKQGRARLAAAGGLLAMLLILLSELFPQPSRSCAFCKIDVSALWIWTEDGTTSMALFSSGFTPGASRKRTTRIYSPATAFMHLPAQPVPVSKAVTSAQMQAMQNAAAAF